MKKKLITSILLFLSIYIIFTGISGAKTIRFWNVGDAYDAIMYRRLAVDFEKETGIKVEVQPISWGQFYTKYLTAMAAGDPPDLATTNLGGPGDYGSVGGLIDLQSRFPNEVTDLKARVFEGPWQAFTFKGKLYGIPHQMTSLGIFYRKDIFQKLGIQPPKTWDELDAVIKTLEQNNYQFIFSWTRDAGWAINQFTVPFGAEVYSEDGSKVNWLDPNFIKGVQYATRVWNTHNMATDKGLDLFISDEKGVASPMMIEGIWLYHQIEKRNPEMKGKWGLIPMPTAPTGKSVSILGGTGFVIFRQSKYPKEAMQWIMYNYRPEVQKEIIKDYMYNRGEGKGLFLSPLKSIWDGTIPDIPTDDQASMKQILYSTQSRSYVIGSPEAGNFMDNAFSRVRNETRDYISGVAKKHNLSRWDLHKAFAQGKYPEERTKYLAFVEKLTNQELHRIAPLGDHALQKAQADYNRIYAGIVTNLPEYEKKKDVLYYAKYIAFGIIFLSILLVMTLKYTRRYWLSYLYISPTLFILIIFLLIPIIVSVYISFTTYNPILPLSTANWVGLDNFKEVLFSKHEIFSNPENANLSFISKLMLFLKENDLWSSMGRSAKFALLVIPLQLLFGVILAVGLDKNLKPDRLFKFIFFSPLVTSVVSVALIWTVLFLGAKYGWINAFLLNLGIVKDPIDFLHDSRTFLNAVIVMSIWQGLAFVILIYLAGLQNIPKEHYEAAAIDGASAFRQFIHITLPSLRPQILFLTITGTIGALQVFEQIYILGGGAGEAGSKFGPADSGMTIVCYIYRKGFEQFQMGEASAAAYVLFAVIFILTYINWKWLLGKKSNE